MLNLHFHPDVQLEVRRAYQWYQSKVVGLGDEFILELESAFQAIEELPDTWPRFESHFRRYLLSQFPFAVIYYEQAESIYILAVMHQSQKPDYWLQRA